MITEDASLLITACRRPAYLEQVLASWCAVPELRQLRSVTFALGRSAREDEQVALIRVFADQIYPVPVHVRWDSAAAVMSQGPHRAIAEAAYACFAGDPGLEYLIFSEEDVVVSSDVLAYMAWARELFDTDQKVLCVSAHNALGQGWTPHDVEDDGADQAAVRLHPFFNPWCWGTWRAQWHDVLGPDWDWDCNKGPNGYDSGYDWQVCRIMKAGGYLSPAPDASRSQNIGKDGGVYAVSSEFPHTQAASFRACRENPSYCLVGE